MLAKSPAINDVLRYYEVIQLSVIMKRHQLRYYEWNLDLESMSYDWYQEISIIPVPNKALLLAGLGTIKI